MDCKQINDPATLFEMLSSEMESVITRAVKCFYSEYREEGYYFCNSRIFETLGVRKERRHELFEDAFSMSLTVFIRYFRNKEFETGRAKVKTVFFTFLIRGLKDAVEKLINKEKNLRDGGSSDIFENDVKTATPDFLTLADELERENMTYHLAQVGFAMLGERCRNLLRWRKYEKLKPEEIAEKMGTIKASSVNQAVHECMEKLRQIIRDLKKED